jgi:chitinase
MSGPRTAIASLLLVLAGVAGTARDAAAPRVVAYVTGQADHARMSAARLTHVNYAFATLDDRGEVVLALPAAAMHLAQLQSLKARNPRLKLLLSVGGWGADGFSDAALDEASRGRFARSAARLLQEYALDGLDVDWEYPGQPGPGITHRPEDRRHFTLLLAALRRELDAVGASRGRTGEDHYLLTIASAGGAYFANTEMHVLHQYLDWVNIMSYDMYGGYTPTTGHHSALLGPPGDASVPSTHAMVAEHLAAGIPAGKLVIGAAFFGKAWNGVRAEAGGVRQPYEAYDREYPYAVLAREFIGRPGVERRWDAEAQAPYLWRAATRTFVSYDDPASLRAKAAYVRAHGLGGIMYWEHAHDPDEVLLGAIADGLSSASR